MVFKKSLLIKCRYQSTFHMFIELLCGCEYGRPMSMEEYVDYEDTRLWLGENESLGHSSDDDVYIIGQKDRLLLSIRDYEEFNSTLRVDEKGDVRINLLEEPLRLEGLSIEQATDVIKNYLKPYTKDELLINHLGHFFSRKIKLVWYHSVK